MSNKYSGVITRFLRDDERFILSEEKEMPLVLEADGDCSSQFAQELLKKNSSSILADMAKYGAVLLRGFNISSDEAFEQTVLSIPEFCGISNAFMAENGRTSVAGRQYVLHTNSIYKTGGTLYLGGFHTENYYSTDVPAYISFCCLEPSRLGGETGIINTQKIYDDLEPELKSKLENNAYFVSKWLVSEIVQRYKLSTELVETVCAHFGLPLVGEGEERFVLMYKPSVFEHPITKEKALQLNLFELNELNNALRKCFMDDYSGSAWFWHRFFWKLPSPVFNSIERLAVMAIALFKSPKNSLTIVKNKLAAFRASKDIKQNLFDDAKVGSCFSSDDVEKLANSMRTHYSSCLWKKGDVLLIDNRKVMHAGMPGQGDRMIRAMICNPVAMGYGPLEPGCIVAHDSTSRTVGTCMEEGLIAAELITQSAHPVASVD